MRDHEKLEITSGIYEQALAVEAERVVFSIDGELLFTSVTKRDIFDLIVEKEPGKYKLQKLKDANWIDVTKYMTLGIGQDVLRWLKNPVMKNATVISAADLISAASRETRLFHHALRRIAFQYVLLPQRHADWSHWSTISTLLDEVNSQIDDVRLDYCIAMLQSSMALKQCQFDINGNLTNGEAVRSALIEGERTLSNHPNLAASTALKMSLAKLASLNDRSTARKIFRELKDSASQDLVEFFYVDMGALSYYADQDLSGLDSKRSESIRDSLQLLGPVDGQSGSKIGVVISLDKHFFRIYAPILLFYFQNIPSIDFNLVVCGEYEDALELKALAEKFSDQLFTINGVPNPGNLFFYHLPVPDFVIDPKTFYACARFFTPNGLLTRYESVYLMDADLSIENDPVTFFSSLSDLVFAAPVNDHFVQLSPWRSVTAGNVVFNRSVLQTRVLDDIQNYISHGLAASPSWMLDQNALLYAAELNQDTFKDLGPYNRPFYQAKFRQTWEKNYWATPS